MGSDVWEVWDGSEASWATFRMFDGLEGLSREMEWLMYSVFGRTNSSSCFAANITLTLPLPLFCPDTRPTSRFHLCRQSAHALKTAPLKAAQPPPSLPDSVSPSSSSHQHPQPPPPPAQVPPAPFPFPFALSHSPDRADTDTHWRSRHTLHKGSNMVLRAGGTRDCFGSGRDTGCRRGCRW